MPFLNDKSKDLIIYKVAYKVNTNAWHGTFSSTPYNVRVRACTIWWRIASLVIALVYDKLTSENPLTKSLRLPYVLLYSNECLLSLLRNVMYNMWAMCVLVVL